MTWRGKDGKARFVVHSTAKIGHFTSLLRQRERQRNVQKSLMKNASAKSTQNHLRMQTCDVLFLQRGCLSSRLSSLGKERISGNNDIPHWICTQWLFLDQHWAPPTPSLLRDIQSYQGALSSRPRETNVQDCVFSLNLSTSNAENENPTCSVGFQLQWPHKIKNVSMRKN